MASQPGGGRSWSGRPGQGINVALTVRPTTEAIELHRGAGRQLECDVRDSQARQVSGRLHGSGSNHYQPWPGLGEATARWGGASRTRGHAQARPSPRFTW